MVPITAALKRRLAIHARRTGRKEAEIVRAAIAEYLRARKQLPRLKPGESLYDSLMAAGIIGCGQGGPADLATNPKHMEGFGRD
jgi:hypothetical protein